MTALESSSTTQSPPPKTPPKKKGSKAQQITDLAGRLIAELRAIKASSEVSLPITVRDLAERCGVSEPALIKKSLGKKKEFSAHAVVVINQSKHKSRWLDSFVCLKEDIPRLVASDELLRFVFELACSGNQRIFTSGQLQEHLTSTAELKKAFKQTLDARLKDDSLPEGVGYLPKDARTNYLFRLADIRPAREAKTAAVSAPTTSEPVAASISKSAVLASEAPTEISPTPGMDDFANRFENAFARLDRESGTHNFVKISDLRRALPEFHRTAFDRGLWLLRKERKFTANSSDGNYEQLSPEDRSAGIREGDSLLIYISRL